MFELPRRPCFRARRRLQNAPFDELYLIFLLQEGQLVAPKRQSLMTFAKHTIGFVKTLTQSLELWPGLFKTVVAPSFCARVCVTRVSFELSKRQGREVPPGSFQ